MISLRNESPSALKSIWSLRRAHQADAEFVAKIFASSRPRLQGQGLGSHLLAAAKKKARAVYACMSSNKIYPLVGSTSSADSNWLNCATVRQMKKASLTLSMSG